MPNMKVMVADDKKIENVGKCHKVKLQMQDYNIDFDFFVVPLGEVDVNPMVANIGYLPR